MMKKSLEFLKIHQKFAQNWQPTIHWINALKPTSIGNKTGDYGKHDPVRLIGTQHGFTGPLIPNIFTTVFGALANGGADLFVANFNPS